MSKTGFNSTVAARTRTAEQILETGDLLDKLEDLGGLRRDMKEIRDAGLEAEAANLGQSQAKSAGKVATMEVLAKFAKVQKENAAVMAVLQAVLSEMKRNNGAPDLIKKLEDIIRNEAQVTVTTVEVEGEKKRRVRKSISQEAVRAEIAKDAGALLALAEIHAKLAERRVTPERLAALLDSAEKMTGLLGTRAAAKGAAKASTKVEREAVARQREVWGSTYRILSALAAKDDRVRSLLAQAKA